MNNQKIDVAVSYKILTFVDQYHLIIENLKLNIKIVDLYNNKWIYNELKLYKELKFKI